CPSKPKRLISIASILPTEFKEMSNWLMISFIKCSVSTYNSGINTAYPCSTNNCGGKTALATSRSQLFLNALNFIFGYTFTISGNFSSLPVFGINTIPFLVLPFVSSHLIYTDSALRSVEILGFKDETFLLPLKSLLKTYISIG